MAKTAYPDQQDIERILRSTGLFDADALDTAILDLDLETLAAAAIREWEMATGWIPFLADSVAVTRYFDPQGPNFRPQVGGGGYVMDLGTGLISLTSITTGVSATAPGSVLTLDTDYWLTPYNADELGYPWTGISFLVPQWGTRRSIKVIGRFGYSMTVPDDAWLAIGHKAVTLALPEIASFITGGVRKFTELGVTEEYGEGFLYGTGGKDDGSIGGVWGREWARAVTRYKRVVV